MKKNHPQLRSSEKCKNYNSHRQQKHHTAPCPEVFCDILSRNRHWLTEKLCEYHRSSSNNYGTCSNHSFLRTKEYHI